MQVGRYTCKACTRVCVWYVGMHVCMGVYDLALGCMYGIAHRDLRTYAVSDICAYSLAYNSIGAEGARHIATALVHNSTLQTLK
jgi:hypothetical protein